MIWQYAAALLTGVLASMGVGGGMLLIIYLTVFAGVQQYAAQAQNLIFFIPIAALSVIIHTKNRLIEWKNIFPSILTGVLGALGGVFLAQHLGSGLLRKIFAGFILLVGFKELLYKKETEKESGADRSHEKRGAASAPPRKA
jgi:uncharacterized membrane protein YfcA